MKGGRNISETVKILADYASAKRDRDPEVQEALRSLDGPGGMKIREALRLQEDAEHEQRNVETNRAIGLVVFGGVSAWALYDIIRHRYGWVAVAAWAMLTLFACVAAWKGPAVKKDGPQFWWRALEVMGILLMLISLAMFAN